MQNRWDSDADRCTTPLALLAYGSRLLGSEPLLVLHGGGNTSLKQRENGRTVLYVKGSGADLRDVTERDFTPLDHEPLTTLLAGADFGNPGMAAALAPHLLRANAPKPSIETFMHAALPPRCVDHTHAAPILAITNTADGHALSQAAFSDIAMIVPYHHSGLELAHACADAWRRDYRPGLCGMILMHHGAVAWGETAREAYDSMIALANRAEAFLAANGAGPVADPEPVRPEPLDTLAIARLRMHASRVAGRPLIATVRDDPVAHGFARRDDLPSITRHGPSTPGHLVMTKRVPLLGRDVARFASDYRVYLGEAGAAAGIDCAPRVILDHQLGLLGLGVTKRHADAAATIFAHDAAIIATATRLDRYATIPRDLQRLAEIEYGGFERRVARDEPLAGQVVVVDQACARMDLIKGLLARGAAVAAIDADPRVASALHAPAYLGLVAADGGGADAGALAERIVRAFGGVDRVAAGPAWLACLEPLLEFAA